MLNRHAGALLTLVICGMVATVRATVLVPAEFREIVNGSQVIAFGRIIDTAADMGEGRARTVTFVTMQVATYLKGGPGETIVFSVPGGHVGRYRDVTIGAPTFAVGDEAVVFLRTSGGDHPLVFGLNQGVFRVRVDARTQRRMVVPPALLARTASAETVTRGSATRQVVPLETFGAQVQAVLAESPARGGR